MKLIKNRTLYRYDEHLCDYIPKNSYNRQTGFRWMSLLFVAVLMSAFVVKDLNDKEFNPMGSYFLLQQEQISGHIRNYNVQLAKMEKEINSIHKNDQGFYRSILNKPTLAPQVWEGGIGGSVSNANQRHMSPPLQEIVRRRERLLYKLNLQKTSFDETMRIAELKSDELKHIPAILPVAGRKTSGFGYRADPFHGHTHFHAGVDISARYGSPIGTSADGVIITAGTPESGYGLQIEVDHGYGYVTKYAHLSRINVSVGQKVKRGQTIGLCGSSGYSTGPHLHYEVIKQGQKVNPEDYFYSSR